MADLIEREKLIDDIHGCLRGTAIHDALIEMIAAQPTAQERPVGHWKRCGVFAHCSNCLCGTIYPSDRDIDFEFCPHCGAKMEAGAAE